MGSGNLPSAFQPYSIANVHLGIEASPSSLNIYLRDKGIISYCWLGFPLPRKHLSLLPWMGCGLAGRASD